MQRYGIMGLVPSFFSCQLISTNYKHLQQTKWQWKYNIKYKHTATTEPYARWKAIRQLKNIVTITKTIS